MRFEREREHTTPASERDDFDSFCSSDFNKPGTKQILLVLLLLLLMVTLNKDGTERKKREPKAKKKHGVGDPTKGGGKSQSKEQLNTQRNVMRETLRQLKEKRKDDPEAFEIGSVYDLALGLELWLNDNSKVRGFSLVFGTI